MSAKIIDGKSVAATVVDKVKSETAKLITATGIVPGIAVVIVGEDPGKSGLCTLERQKGKRMRVSFRYPQIAARYKARCIAGIDR